LVRNRISIIFAYSFHFKTQTGSEEQRQKYVPLLRDLTLTGGWGLTESKHGSDASSIETTVQKTEGSLIFYK